MAKVGKLHTFYKIPLYRWPLLLANFRGTRDGWEHFNSEPEDGKEHLQPVIAKPNR